MAKIHPKKLFNLDNDLSESDKKLFLFYRNKPIEAVKDLLNQDLPPFQRIVIRSNMEHPFVMNALFRGAGKTRMIAMLNALDAMFNPNIKIAGLSPGFRNSKYIFAALEELYNESEYLQQCVSNVSKQPDVWRMDFINGATVYALPLASDSKLSIRGLRVHKARIDEYPHVPEDVINAVIKPMAVTSLNPMKEVRRLEQQKKMLSEGRIEERDMVSSSANSIQGFSSAYFQFNHFYKTITKYKEAAKTELLKYGKTKYDVNIFNYKDAPEGFLKQDIIDDAKLTSSSIVFRMEYLSEFPSDSDGFFKRSLLDTCISRKPNDFYIELEGEKGFKYFLGIDPAREKDAFAIHILKLAGNEMRWVRCITYQSVPFPIIAKDIRQILKDYDVELMGMDRGGGGSTMKDLLADPMTAHSKEDIILDMDDEKNIGVSGRKILKIIDFSPNWISDANFNLQSSFEHKRLMFPNIILADKFIKPEDDESDPSDMATKEFAQTLNELSSIEVKSTSTGVLHFDTPSQSMRKDRYSSLLIAHKILYDFIRQGYQQRELVSGGWYSEQGILNNDEEEDSSEWRESRMLDVIQKARETKINVGNGALVDK